MNQTTELTTIVEQQGLEKSKVEGLLTNFGKFFAEAKTIAADAKSIVVTDEAQKDLMLAAREKRLALKAIRVEVEKTRVELKEQSLREGRAIDGISNVIKALIVPVEEHLEKQEKFAELREAERLAKRHADRIESLSKYVEDVSLYNLKDMSDDAFAKLLASSKTAFEAQKAAEAKAEEERIAAIKAKEEEDRKIREENEKLRKEREEAEKARAKEREAEQKKLEAERKAREEAEKKLAEEKRIQQEKERKAAEEAAAKKKAEEDARHAAMVAPDKEKLLKLADTLQMIQFPAVESAKAKGSLERLEQKLGTIISVLREEAKQL